MVKKNMAAAIVVTSLLLCAHAGCVDPGALNDQQSDILQPLGLKPLEMEGGGIYIPSTADTVQWGSLPNRETEPLLTVSSGAVVTFDSVSHEGILEDQGRDPVTYLGQHGVAPDQVLDDARAIQLQSWPTISRSVVPIL